MKIQIESPINKYYVQTLCMIFFPGIKFGNDDLEDTNEPSLFLKTESDENGISSFAVMLAPNALRQSMLARISSL